ncbi:MULTISPECIES: alpha/beta hydrolase [Pseudomonas]|uniref:Alpha/beta fold hydrolase n=1 Tax=Pseudomonas gingeri TaxID=117681 RepID=A0A7Y7WX01_9PSED|nr:MULTISPECIES: alpha/beta fold hydrolase [Pseudomonas]MPQ70744.1 alpha/beta fold hydrolase [Pseudomonas sp. MWU12-2323]NWB89214.1 alpha/beta fold hydrolase [Pseudomonas gingeri]
MTLRTFIARRRWLSLGLLAVFLAVGLPYGCSRLAYKERELLFNVQPGTASWFSGVPAGVRELRIPISDGVAGSDYLHAWWWPSSRANAPAILYLHGTRWNLTAQVGRITQLRDLGFSVLAIDYRGFGDSPGSLPSERSVYQDADNAWKRLVQLQPDVHKRYIYGHSLGGAVAVDLAERLAGDKAAPKATGLIIESTFTDLGDAARAAIPTSLPVSWILSEKFDSIDKINQIDIPVLIVHGTDDPYVPSRFSQALYEAAAQPKQLLLIKGGNHINSMTLGSREYAKALRQAFEGFASPVAR